MEANSLKHAIPPCRLAYGEFKSVFGNYFLCGERWLETRLWAYAKHNYENHKYHHEIDTWNRRKRATRCVPMDASSHLYKRVCPSVGPSVRPLVGLLCLCKNRVSRLFLATVRSYTETNDQPTCFESLFTHLSFHLSLHTYVTWSILAETQPGRIVARSGLFFSEKEREHRQSKIYHSQRCT